MKFDKNGKPRPWTAEELRDFLGFFNEDADHREDEAEFHGDRPRSDYRPPPVTFRSEKWLPTRLSKRIRPAADSIRECAECSRDLNERIDCLKRAKRDYREIRKDFIVELDWLRRNGEKNYDLNDAFLGVSGYINEINQALQAAIAEYREVLAPGGQDARERRKHSLNIDPQVLKKILEQLALSDNGFVEKADFDQVIKDNFSDDEGPCGESRINWTGSVPSYRYWFRKMQETDSFGDIGDNYAVFFTHHFKHGKKLLTREQVCNNRSDPKVRDRNKIDRVVEFSLKNQ
jgi:hypothetical protein